MRNALIVLVVMAATLPAGVDPADAQRQPRPWCLTHGGNDGPGGGLPDCTYHTLAQCMASRAGSDGCSQNPALGWDRIEGRRTTPPRGQGRDR